MAEQTRWLDLTDQKDLLARGQIKPADLLDAAIERIEHLDPALNAVTTRYFDQAREAAGSAEGPLAGVPFLVKDLTADVAGQVRTDANSALKAQSRAADRDSPLVDLFRSAGLVVVGRTTSSEFGTLPTAESRAWGVTRNPWDLSRSPGGSSGGSAAAVAAGMVAAAHASDAAGSLRIPASGCGLVGLKPSRPADSGPPVSVQALISEFVVTRSVRDAALLLDLTQPGPTAADVTPAPLRIGLLDSRIDGSPVHPACAAAVRLAAGQLEELGHHVEPGFPTALGDATLGRLFSAYFATGILEVFEEVARRLGRELTEADVEPLNWALATLGAQMSSTERESAFAAAPAFIRSVLTWWDHYDLLLTPTTAEPSLPVGALGPEPANPLAGLERAQAFAPFTPFVNMTGQPAISLPLASDEQGRPTGVQLVGRPGAERVLLAVAAQLEVAAPWKDRRPPS
ncbi:amidase [Kineosporia succinea]|uniref:Cellulase n=1 Tax=Kineosporia succinea TaxID=84632 RepID=A0ABT9PCA4_9ACTN|nr:amidase [Kineosporia succinea]MDP9830336.1 amidase [Kineosporia succinea]